jgi:hypothetical protein
MCTTEFNSIASLVAVFFLLLLRIVSYLFLSVAFVIEDCLAEEIPIQITGRPLRCFQAWLPLILSGVASQMSGLSSLIVDDLVVFSAHESKYEK